jgi:hypothetical protein
MKAIVILKKLVYVYYYLLLIGLIAWPIRALFKIIKKSDYVIKAFGVNKNTNEVSMYEGLSLIVAAFIFIAIYTRAIYLIKQSINDLSSGNYFTSQVISNFKGVGFLFLSCGIGEIIMKFILGLLFNSKMNIKFDTSIVLFIIMGLFFLFLSEVFKEAKQNKEENDLTI